MNDDFDYAVYVCDEVSPLLGEELKQLKFYSNRMESYRN